MIDVLNYELGKDFEYLTEVRLTYKQGLFVAKIPRLSNLSEESIRNVVKYCILKNKTSLGDFIIVGLIIKIISLILI